MPTVPDIHRRGTRAAQAALAAPPLTVGTLYFVTDESVTERWNGTGWENYSDSGGVLVPGPHAATHASAGSDPLNVATLAGYPGGTTTFLRADGTFAAPAAGTPGAHHASHETGGSDALTALAASVITTGTIASARLPPRLGAVGLIIDGGGSAITTGVKAFVEVPFAGTITAVTVLSTDAAVTSGSIVIDLWKDTYANYPPTVADTITASAKPTLASATKSRDTTLTGWTTAIAAGDILGFKVDSASTVTKVLISLTVQAT
jgi:hypothetical protein